MIAAYPGSFDPIHLGHLSAIERAAGRVDEVVVLVLANPAKTHLLPAARRVELVAASTAHLPNVRAVAHEGLAVDGARAVGATALVRNAGKERRTERTMADANLTAAGLRTLLLPPDPDTAAISSSFVRELAAAGHHEDIAALVPPPVHAALLSLEPGGG